MRELFGYVKPVVKELLVKEYEFYKATYCGICRSMKKKTGALSNVTLSYDSVFLALVRMAYIDDSEISTGMKRCVAHPLKKRCMLVCNSATDYTARAFGILTYYKLLDDISDESLGKRLSVGFVKPIAKKAKRKAQLSDLEKIAKEKLDAITALEREESSSVDRGASLFGELLGEIFSAELEGDDRLVTYQCGFHLGRFIYAADAAEDYEEDLRLGRYNPFVKMYGGAPLTRENKETIRCSLILECRKLESAVNLIPFGNKRTAENIVKNIIYLGLVKRIEFLDSDSSECDRCIEKGKI